MKLIITDEEADLVTIAKAKEHHDRAAAFAILCTKGHVRVLEDNDPITIRCQIEDEIFSCEREKFPTTELMARLQLAIAAGRSERNMVSTDAAMSQVDVYAALSELRRGDRVWMNEEAHSFPDPRSRALEAAHKVTAGITAAVKRLPKALQKGLRP